MLVAISEIGAEVNRKLHIFKNGAITANAECFGVLLVGNYGVKHEFKFNGVQNGG